MKFVSYNIDENIRQLSDKALLSQTDLLAQEHRKNTILLLRHLREVEIRRLFVDLGYTSMHKYCLKRLKFSEGEAQRRLTSARLLTELPEIEKQIEAGDLNVTNLSKIQSFLRVEKAANHPFDKAQKLELIQQMENKSTRQVERELVGLSHQPALMAEKFQCSTSLGNSSAPNTDNPLLDSQYLKFEALLGTEQQELLAEFRNLYAHELSDFAEGAILVFLLEKAVHHKKKKLGLLENGKPSQAKDTKPTNAARLPSAPKVTEDKMAETTTSTRTPQRKYIKAALKKHIWQRAKACCEYQDPHNQKRCTSKWALELDHIQPVALGGSEDLANLRLLCRVHNSRRAVKTFRPYSKPNFL